MSCISQNKSTRESGRQITQWPSLWHNTIQWNTDTPCYNETSHNESFQVLLKLSVLLRWISAEQTLKPSVNNRPFKDIKCTIAKNKRRSINYLAPSEFPIENGKNDRKIIIGMNTVVCQTLCVFWILTSRTHKHDYQTTAATVTRILTISLRVDMALRGVNVLQVSIQFR